MDTGIKFGVYEKEVKALTGDNYDLGKFVEGVDYRKYKIRVGHRVMFRNGILEELGGKVPEQSEPQVKEDVKPAKAEKRGGIYEVVVTRKYPNPRYVETTGGQVFVGGKPVKLGQKIQVRNNELVLKRTSYLG
jgi:hypothetical protein